MPFIIDDSETESDFLDAMKSQKTKRNEWQPRRLTGINVDILPCIMNICNGIWIRIPGTHQ